MVKLPSFVGRTPRPQPTPWSADGREAVVRVCGAVGSRWKQAHEAPRNASAEQFAVHFTQYHSGAFRSRTGYEYRHLRVRRFRIAGVPIATPARSSIR